MRLSFHGAAGGVTGSCFMLTVGDRRLLVDCGMFQGAHEHANAAPFGFEPPDIDTVILTHAHLDHTGRLPLLVKRGFRGRVHATAPTRDIARLALLDAAGLQRDDARRRRRQQGGRRQAPLYDDLDVMDALDRFDQPLDYDSPREVLPNVHVTLVDAGHILGSAYAIVEAEGKRIAFSGDIGNVGKPLVRDPTRPPPSDIVVMETTYGDRDHRPFLESTEELYAAIRLTGERGGNVVIPSFAIERAQELLYVLRMGIEQDKLPHGLHAYLDSPMAISATRLYSRYPDELDAHARKTLASGVDPLDFFGLRFTHATPASRGIRKDKSGAVIIAGSGMCTGGRVLGHLLRELPRKESSIVFVAFASHGTLARRIIEGEREVRVQGKMTRVRAQRFTINGFSSHAGQDELLAWQRATGAARTFLVHGADEPRAAMAEALSGRTEVTMPELHDAFDI